MSPEINGVPVITADPIGYSEKCGIATRVDYLCYGTLANTFLPLSDTANVPADVEKITVGSQDVNFVVRLERGTINHFIYSIAMLAPFNESLDSPKLLHNAAWNRKLLYKF